MNSLLQKYRAIHTQGFMPIFVADHFDSRTLVEGCVQAGMTCIEYTLRRPDAHEMIPWIRKHYPELLLLAGSTLDNEMITRSMRRRHPQLLTIAELADLGVDGFVSMIGWSEESISLYSKDFLVAPVSMTVSEAFFQIAAGAHFAKILGPEVDLVKKVRSAAAFDYCPVFVTGGMTPERIPPTIDAGAILVGSGFDLTLKSYDSKATAKDVATEMRRYMDAVCNARDNKYPELSATADKDDTSWLQALPHYTPFLDGGQ